MLEKIAPLETHPQMRYEEYLALPEEGPLVEWVHEEVVVHMPAKPIHQRVVTFLAQLLGIFVRFFGLGEVLVAPTEVKCFPDGNSREPDILFLSKDHLGQVGDRRIEGTPDLIIEIISDDSVARDLDDKFFEYQQCGVPEYWVVDPRPKRQRAWFYQLGEDGVYQAVPLQGGIYRSRAIPGFWLKAAWLWEQPDPQLTFAEIAGFPEEIMAFLRVKKAGG